MKFVALRALPVLARRRGVNLPAASLHYAIFTDIIAAVGEMMLFAVIAVTTNGYRLAR